MQPHDRPIEIFAPFSEAFELMRKILFQPFDLTKWFVIGFAAWIATFFSGGGFGYRHFFGDGDWHWRSYDHGPPISWHDTPPWAIPLILIGGPVILAMVIVLLWLNSRGRFVFTDCIVRNRAAIAEPWREYRSEGNGYFAFQLIVLLGLLFLGGGVALLLVLGWYGGNRFFPVAVAALLGVVIVLGAVLLSLVLHLMVPVMYRRRCEATEAFRDVMALISANPGAFVLFVLFYIVFVVAAGAIGCVAACVTCCLAAIPYLGTVILLPVVMVLYAFPLCFLRQFGEQYDAWAVVRPTGPPPIPPVQEILPPS